MKYRLIFCIGIVYLLIACSVKKQYNNYVISEKEKLKKEVTISDSEKVSDGVINIETVAPKLSTSPIYDALPKSLNLKPFLTEVKNQGSRYTCAYFAFCGFLEAVYKKKYKKDINLSEEYLISLNQGNFYGASETCAINSVATTYLKHGIVEENTLPYQPTWTNYGFPYHKYRNIDSIPANAYKSNKPKEIYSNIPFKNINLEAVRGLPRTLNVLVKDSLPVIGIFIFTKDRYSHYDSINGSLKKTTYSDIRNLDDKTGEIKFEIPKSYKVVANDTIFENYIDEDNWENHFMLITGYDKDIERIYFKNSWGKSFGEDGYGFISFSEFKKSKWFSYRLIPESDIQLFEDSIPKSNEIKIEEEALQTKYTKEGTLEILFTGKIQTIPYKSLLIEHKIYELDATQKSLDNDISKAKVFTLNENNSKTLDDNYIRTYWNSLSDKTKDNFIWTTHQPLKSKLSKQKMKTFLNQYNPDNNYYICTTITTYDDLNENVVLKRIWTPIKI